MADSKSEQVLKALYTALASRAVPLGVLIERNGSVPLRLPSEGYICLRDGEPGEPEVLLSPPTYIYEHLAEVDVVVQAKGAAARDALFDTLKRMVGAAIADDRTLGGLCDYVLGDAPMPVDLPVEGAEYLKAGTIGVILSYQSSDPLL